MSVCVEYDFLECKNDSIGIRDRLLQTPMPFDVITCHGGLTSHKLPKDLGNKLECNYIL